MKNGFVLAVIQSVKKFFKDYYKGILIFSFLWFLLFFILSISYNNALPRNSPERWIVMTQGNFPVWPFFASFYSLAGYEVGVVMVFIGVFIAGGVWAIFGIIFWKFIKLFIAVWIKIFRG